MIDSVDIDERDVNGAESLQEKISKESAISLQERKKESEEEFMKEEEEAPAEEVPEEMIKDISSEAELTNVPELEPEDAVIPPPATPGTSIFSTIEEKIEEVTNQEIKDEQEETPEEVTEEVSEEELPDVVIESEETDAEEAEELPEAEEEPEIEEVEIPEEEVKPLETEDDFVDSAEEEETKLPELEIPEAMKNVGMENPLHTEIPKAPDICLPGAEDSEETPDFEFNLEDTILAAATAQGIEIPDEPIVKEEPVQEVNTAEEDAEDYMSEEDLRSAEEEFLNGPVKKQDPEEEIYDDLDSYKMEDDSDEDFGEEDGYEDEDISDLEEEEFLADQYEDTVKAAKTPEKKPTLRKSGRKEKQQEPEDDDMEQLLYTVEPKRKARISFREKRR